MHAPNVYSNTIYSRQDMEAPHLFLIIFLHVPVPHASDAFSCPAALFASYEYPKPLPSGEAYLRLSSIFLLGCLVNNLSLCCRPWRLSICLAASWGNTWFGKTSASCWVLWELRPSSWAACVAVFKEPPRSSWLGDVSILYRVSLTTGCLVDFWFIRIPFLSVGKSAARPPNEKVNLSRDFIVVLV